MTKIKYYINVETPHVLNNEQKMEILADIRYVIRNYKSNLPDLKIIVGRELSNEDIMESLGGVPIPTINYPQPDSQSIESCIHYDEAQGRNKCSNPLVKTNKCLGVCKDYKDKR